MNTLNAPAHLTQSPSVTGKAAFDASRERFDEMLNWLRSSEAASLSHGEMEEQLDGRGRELLRELMQDHLRLHAVTERRLETVVDSDGVSRGTVEAGHRRPLSTVFGEVEVERLAYRHRDKPNLYPLDGVLNLPEERHSHGVRRLAAIESSRGSFEEASDAICRATGQHVAKRQVETLAERAAVDVDAFYATRTDSSQAPQTDVLVLSADGKGIVMRPDGLRPATAKAAAEAATKLECRLSKGEKRNRKRLAEVGAVYDLTPVARTPADILAPKNGEKARPAPKAKEKWVSASVVEDAAAVIAGVFEEAERRDPSHSRRWVALVDGNNHQLVRLKAEAQARAVDLRIVVDFIHVLEYLWGAVWCFFAEGDKAAEVWVHDRALAILQGKARGVAAGIRRRATQSGLNQKKRTKADACAAYLTHKAGYLDYPTALAEGWPVASGVIEGTCRYLVADRMDITGARWSVAGAEAILKLRAVRANDDFSEYWQFHLEKERHRIHEIRYDNETLPIAA
jgi:Uncharacterised protein family (UPF0236)